MANEHQTSTENYEKLNGVSIDPLDEYRNNRVPVRDGQDEQGYTQINWQQWVYDGPDGEGYEIKGVSLRQMVEDTGLYSRMDHAVRALERADLDFSSVQGESTGGRPSTDYILSLRDAQKFAVRVQTEVGDAVADHILDHYNEFQKLLGGDKEVARRAVEHIRLTQPEQSAPDTIDQDPIMQMVNAVGQLRAAQLEQERRQRELDRRVSHVDEEVGEVREQVGEINDQLGELERDARLLEPKTARAEINQLVRTYAKQNGEGDYQKTWGDLYTEFDYRYHKRIQLRARNKTERTGQKFNALDIAEEQEWLPKLLALARHMYE